MKLAFDLILHTLFHRVSPSCLIARGGISVTHPDGIALLRPGLPSPARHSNSPISACLASPVCPASRYAIFASGVPRVLWPQVRNCLFCSTSPEHAWSPERRV